MKSSFGVQGQQTHRAELLAADSVCVCIDDYTHVCHLYLHSYSCSLFVSIMQWRQHKCVQLRHNNVGI